MNQQRFEAVRDDYPEASWATWSREFPESGCIEETPEKVYEFIEQHRDRLNTGIVLVSLNPSRELPADFSNFHSPSRTHYDHRLNEFIQSNDLDRITGAYMTDLSVDIDPRSENVNPGAEEIERFLNQLETLGEDEYHVICFIGKVFATLRSVFDGQPSGLEYGIKSFDASWNGRTLHVHRVWFYGNWGANADKVPELERQLEYLNDEVIE
jgi:hypothetical protein